MKVSIVFKKIINLQARHLLAPNHSLTVLFVSHADVENWPEWYD